MLSGYKGDTYILCKSNCFTESLNTSIFWQLLILHKIKLGNAFVLSTQTSRHIQKYLDCEHKINTQSSSNTWLQWSKATNRENFYNSMHRFYSYTFTSCQILTKNSNFKGISILLGNNITIKKSISIMIIIAVSSNHTTKTYLQKK